MLLPLFILSALGQYVATPIGPHVDHQMRAVNKCEPGSSPSKLAKPKFLTNIKSEGSWGEVTWFASPLIYDLDNDGQKELICAYYSVIVYDSELNEIARHNEPSGRVYAPHVIADLDGDGTMEIAFGRGDLVYALEWDNNKLKEKSGWPYPTALGETNVEVRGLSAGSMDGRNNTIEVVATTTHSEIEVHVISHDGEAYQPSDGHDPAWPRYNDLSGAGNDADANGCGHNGYGSYGLNAALGDVDGDGELEVIATYDNHHIQVFKKDGIAMLQSPFYTQRSSTCPNERMSWGQFIRWTDPETNDRQYHEHDGAWPNPGNGDEWLQWTSSPPGVYDIDLDGKAEVFGVSNIEVNDPYETQAWGLVVLNGWPEDDAGLRKKGWETIPRGTDPNQQPAGDWYPPATPPAVTVADITGDDSMEMIFTTNDHYVRCYDCKGEEIWSRDISHNKAVMYSSEVVVVDLNQDGQPELVLSTFGDPDVTDSGYLMILEADSGKVLFDIPLPNPGSNGNGNGGPAAPTVGDLDGDGELEIYIQTFDHGLDVFTVPGSAENCLIWPTARGGPLRQGRTAFYDRSPSFDWLIVWLIVACLLVVISVGFAGVAGYARINPSSKLGRVMMN